VQTHSEVLPQSVQQATLFDGTTAEDDKERWSEQRAIAPSSSPARIQLQPPPQQARLAYVGQPSRRYLETLAALSEATGRPGPLVLSGYVHGQLARCLVDYGTTCNLMSLKTAERAFREGSGLNVAALPATGCFHIELGDGSRAMCGRSASARRSVKIRQHSGQHVNCCITCSKHQFDLVPGTPWLEANNPAITWRREAGSLQ